MTRMLEKAARAVSVIAYGDEGMWESCVDEARAVLEAIREPDEEMIEAGIEAFRESAGVLVARRDPPIILAAMIDAILSEKDKP